MESVTFTVTSIPAASRHKMKVLNRLWFVMGEHHFGEWCFQLKAKSFRNSLLMELDES